MTPVAAVRFFNIVFLPFIQYVHESVQEYSRLLLNPYSALANSQEGFPRNGARSAFFPSKIVIRRGFRGGAGNVNKQFINCRFFCFIAASLNGA
jgi:hypothetical protein